MGKGRRGLGDFPVWKERKVSGKHIKSRQRVFACPAYFQFRRAT